MVSRRKWLVAMGAGALLAPHASWAQQAGKTYRIGWLSSSNNYNESYLQAFTQRLAELGFVEARNLTIERRHADNKLERLPAVAAELGKLKCDVFFGGGNEASLAALTKASRTTPIVFVAVDFDPVATGDVASLARPGGRMTGLTGLVSQLPAKRLELMNEMFPALRRIAVFANDQTAAQLALVQGTARRLGLDLHVVDFKRPPFDYPAGFADAVRAKSDALFVLGSGLWVPARRLIPELAIKAKLPAVFHHGLWVESGGLMSYGVNFSRMWRRGAEMVVNVLQGAKPADIPMEQPTEFELVINQKTASALGMKIPNAILLRADRVVG